MRAVTFAAAAAVLTSSLVSAQATVYLIRHGEKPSDGGDGLSSQGQQRAQCLVNVFSTSSPYGIGYIMAETPKSDGSRARPYDTVEPLANSLGLSVDTSCDRDDSDCVANVVESYSGSGNILICWEHNALTDIVSALGDSNAPDYPDDSFNLIWTDPSDYGSITATTNECCPGLDSC
ncbi:putative phosphoglycerate mutase family protein [Polychaeton citri CBS 116435]|uniref:Phosphoglycerate mutase family protein n=1 Tax=Polychaeton citri CBS 116435 TaxID=1314669 RepID=A0A9P4Q6J4_9PEZI|nr:putative phosphoglycerate mutase family protein [Polychaeton citri CBS 116435]